MLNPLSLLNPAAAVAAAAAEVIGAVQGRRAATGLARGEVARDVLLEQSPHCGVRRRVGTARPRGRNPVGWAPRPLPAPRTPTTPKSAPSTKATGDFAFLSDPRLTIEEKLMRLLAALSQRWEKEMQAKMEQIAADENNEPGAKSSGSSSTKKSSAKGSSGQGGGSGLLGGIGDVFSGLLGGVGGSGGGGLLGGLGGGLGGLFGVLGGAGGGGGGGLLGGLGGLLSGVMGGAGGGFGGALDVLKDPGLKDLLGKISGPVLAAAASALGCPMAAPILMQLGPALVDGAASLASANDADASATSGRTSGSRPGGSTRTSGSSSSGASSSSSSSSGTSSASGDKKMSDSQRQLLMMEIQRIYERQKEMFGIVSNILKMSHETRMNAVNNVR